MQDEAGHLQCICMNFLKHGWIKSWMLKVWKMPLHSILICMRICGDAWDVELVGTSEFDAEDEDWACGEVFDTRENPFSWEEGTDWETAASRVVSLVKEYLEKGKYAEQLKTCQGIGVGFVDGNIEIVYVNPLPENGIS